MSSNRRVGFVSGEVYSSSSSHRPQHTLQLTPHYHYHRHTHTPQPPTSLADRLADSLVSGDTRILYMILLALWFVYIGSRDNQPQNPSSLPQRGNQHLQHYFPLSVFFFTNFIFFPCQYGKGVNVLRADLKPKLNRPETGVLF